MAAIEFLIIVYLNKSNTPHPLANPPASNLNPAPSNRTHTLLALISLKRALDILLHHLETFCGICLLRASTAAVVACHRMPSLIMLQFCFQLHLEGVQNRPPQDVLLWHVDHFEWKTIETLMVRRGAVGLGEEDHRGQVPF